MRLPPNNSVYRRYENQEEEADSQFDSEGDSYLDSLHSRSSELKPLTPQQMNREESIKVLTGVPLQEYIPQRKSRASQNKASLLTNDGDSQPSRRSKQSVSFQSPPMQKIPQLYQAGSMDSQEDGTGTPMSYFPSKYRMERALRPVRTDRQNERPYLSPNTVMSSPSPSNQSQATTQTNQSNFSQASYDSRLSSNMSYRSSTSKSLFFGEVINLEDTRKQQQRMVVAGEESANFLGMEIGASRKKRQVYRSNQHLPLHDNSNTRHLPQGISASYFLDILKDAKNLGHTAHYGIKELGAKSIRKTKELFQYYRAPLSPRTKALKDLEFLQRVHREKVGQFAVDEGLEDHWDFALVLTPQEVYRFWSALLDFRVEHLGSEALFKEDHLLKSVPSLKSASTDSTEKTGGSESGEETSLQENIYSTPVTGIKRRRGKTPPSDNKHLLRSTAKSIFTAGDMDISYMTGTSKVKQRFSMFEKAVADQAPPSRIKESRNSDGSTEDRSSVRRRWGNHTQGSIASKNLLSPPVRSLTRGASSVQKPRLTNTSILREPMESLDEKDEERERVKVNPNMILSEEDIPNPVIPRGIAARTNGLLKFLSVLQRGIVLRRHRPNKEALYCKIYSSNGGDTIQYELIDPEEAMVAFKEQRVRYNRNLTNSSSPTSIHAAARDWARLDNPGDGTPMHKFKVPDHIAAQKYRQKLSKEVSKRLLDIAVKAANSGIIKTTDVVAVHPAAHLDPRHPGVRRGELGTASLRKSKSDHFTPHTFSIVTSVRQKFPSAKTNQNGEGSENKWYSGDGNEMHFKTLDFEAATEGEYWLIFRGFLLLHRDATVGRFAAERRAGIGGGARNREEDGQDKDFENILHRDEFTEPKTVGCLQRLIVNIRDMDKTFMEGDMIAGARPPPSDYFLGFKAPGTQVSLRFFRIGKGH